MEFAEGVVWQCPPTAVSKTFVPEQISGAFVGLREDNGEGKNTLAPGNILNLIVYTKLFSCFQKESIGFSTKDEERTDTYIQIHVAQSLMGKQVDKEGVGYQRRQAEPTGELFFTVSVFLPYN